MADLNSPFDSLTIDADTLEILREALADEFQPLLQAFLDETPQHLQALHRSLDNTDLDDARRIAHVVKGTSGNLGIMAFSAVCQDVEEAAKVGDKNAARSNLQRAAQAFEQAREALQPYLQP